MRARHPLAVVLSAACALVLGVAGPAAASVGHRSALAVVAPPACQIASPENITGAMLVNNQIVNGTWKYSTGVACGGSALADIALYEELDFNGVKVDSKLKNFTGVARNLDAITSSVHCNVCNGTWLFKWGQILQAPSGFMFTNPPAGCVVLQNGLYQLCVQTKTVVL
ncbi:MAG: hypothetical protein QOF81_733 [Acidimicrobiaceae bacterium]|jgi:hypothetical protein|nr:hypothetical protein [Acidimicrobiaceae bacterium]MDQ1415120.1 hypothetical protein [Acidimicrobiaceae bacterium]MDQ1443341.1 hypothetical protein [Acidimicrobiaceae bacterium]